MVSPDSSNLTDEDAANVDDGGVIETLSPRPLSSQVEIIVWNNEEIYEILAKEASSIEALYIEK